MRGCIEGMGNGYCGNPILEVSNMWTKDGIRLTMSDLNTLFYLAHKWLKWDYYKIDIMKG